VLAERNRQEKLLAESEQAARAEQAAKAEAKRLAESTGALERDRDSAVSEHRAAINRRDEAAEQERRLSAQIERRRSAPPEGEHAGRIAQLRAELRGEQDRSERLAKERAERERRIQHLQASIASGEALAPEIEGVISDLRELAELIAARRAEFDEALRADREAGEQAAVALRQAAQEEAALQNRLNSANNALTNVEVRRQRAEDQAREAETVLAELASELELAPEAAEEALAEDERQSLNDRLARLAKRREQIGPVNPLAEQEYQEALEHVEELEKQREDLENALRELEKLIRETDQQIRETFQATFDAAAANFEELAPKVFPGGSGRLRLVQESDGRAGVIGGEESGGGEPPEELDAGEPESGGSDDIAAGVEIEITPAGKAMKRLTLLSGGEKSMTALAFLFAVFLARPCPFYIMDEVEAALDDLNISRFLDLLDTYSTRAQFIVVTHQKRTMEAADSLYGVSMGGDGISKVISRRLPDRAAEAA
ncbi:MAG: hypothetical protein J2O48_12315, partial [Solirubrobacterales bacterium]|nr:hypothetical protein [Solirubrobacterales bacterium]